MIVLSIDIGIKNLALIQMKVETENNEENKYDILSWDLLNISAPEKPKIMCGGHLKSGNPCKSKGIYKTKHDFFCKKHACDSCKLVPKRKAKKPIVNDLCKRLIIELDKHPDYLLSDRILIENQPCMINPMIKSVQMMVFTYFIMRNSNIEIKLVHANRKNKIFKDDPDPEPPVKSKYLRIKKKGIVACERLLCNDKDRDFFAGHGKKDDLSDAFLQAWSVLFY